MQLSLQEEPSIYPLVADCTETVRQSAKNEGTRKILGLDSVMALLYKIPAMTRLMHKQMPYRGEWVINLRPDLLVHACHEVQQMNGDRKVVENLTLNSLADAQAFSAHLRSFGWSRIMTQ